jgi:hypothetical protein
MRRVAQAGLLRSYLLKTGERACAFVIGYQFSRHFNHRSSANRCQLRLDPQSRNLPPVCARRA